MNAILPLLNKFIPVGIALNGINKLNPKLRNFITAATGAGYTTDAALDFLRNKIENPNYIDHQNQLEQGAQQGTLRPDEAASRQRINQQEQIPNSIQQGASLGAGLLGGALGALGTENPQSQALAATSQPQQPPSQAGPANPKAPTPPPAPQQPAPPAPQQPGGFMNFISKHPDLGKFLEKEIQSGHTPADAALAAKGIKKYKSAIDDIESNVGQTLEDILSQFYQGTSQAKQPTNKMEGLQGDTQKAIADAIRAYLANKKGING